MRHTCNGDAASAVNCLCNDVHLELQSRNARFAARDQIRIAPQDPRKLICLRDSPGQANERAGSLSGIGKCRFARVGAGVTQ